MTTRLIVTGTPGRPYSGFAAKPAEVVSKGAGPFTRINVTGTPSRRYAGFVAKPVETIPKGIGPFTRLKVSALPSRRYATFIAKPPEDVIVTPPDPGTPSGGGGALVMGGHAKAYRESMLQQARMEDEFIIEAITAIIRVL